MKYIWQNYSTQNDFYIDEKPLSPYLEVGYVGTQKIGVNPVPRLLEVFAPLLDKESSKDFEPLANCLLHYIAQLDLKSGLHVTSFLEYQLDKELREGFFGTRAKEMYLSMDESEQRIILIYLQRHEAAQGLKVFFFDAVLQFFPATKFYFYEHEEKFLFYIPVPKTEHNEKLMELLIFLLFDLGTNYEIFWNCHFGIIDEAETMALDEVVIY